MENPIDVWDLVELLCWLSGCLVTIVLSLVGVIYSTLTKEVKTLREWRHEIVEPALNRLGVLHERVKNIEEIQNGQ